MRKQQEEEGKNRSSFVGMSWSSFALVLGWAGQSVLCEGDVLVSGKWGASRWGCEVQAQKWGRDLLHFPSCLTQYPKLHHVS